MNAFAKLGLGTVLATGLTGGLLAVQALVPNESGVVQTAQAKASKAKVKKAKAAYRAFMETKGWKWGTVTNPPAQQEDYEFALADVNADGLPELYVHGTNLAFATNTARAYVYHKGKVKRAGSFFRTEPRKIYTKGRLLYHHTLVSGVYLDGYYQLKKGKFVKVASARADWASNWDSFPEEYRNKPIKHTFSYNGMVFNYTKLKVMGKSVSWSGYKAGLKKLRKGSTKAKKIKYHTNTEANRAKYL